MSSTLSDTPPAASAPAAAAAGRSRPHIIAFDLIRLIIMVFVVSVHTLAFAGGRGGLRLRGGRRRLAGGRNRPGV